MNHRHRAREIALQILYQYDLANPISGSASKPTSVGSAPGLSSGSTSAGPSTGSVVGSSSSGSGPLSASQIIRDLQHHFDHFQVPAGLREFVGQLVGGTLNEITALDAIIDEHMSNWKISRLSSVDRCLLRMATYEMLRLHDTPDAVVIDEAVELAKQFGTSETPAFINGVLDGIKSKAVPSIPSE